MSVLGDHFKLNPENKYSSPKSTFKGKNYRITILSDTLLRLEYSESGMFFDDFTELARNRKFPDFNFTVTEDEKSLIINTKYYRLQYIKNKPFTASAFAPDAHLRVDVLDTEKYWYYGSDEAANVKVFDVDIDTKKAYTTESEAILETTQKESKIKSIMNIFGVNKRRSLFSFDGYASIDDSKSFIIDDSGYLVKPDKKRIDIYLFVYKNSFIECLKSYFTLTGYPPLIPRYALGIWWYKDAPYTFQNIRDLIYEFNKYRIPLSTILLGSNWHMKDNNNLERYKSGFTFNQEKLGSATNFTNFLHQRGIRLGVNIDPTEGIHPHEFHYHDFAASFGVTDSQIIPFNGFDKNLIVAYLDKLITPLYNDNIDFFWIDYKSKLNDNLIALNYYHYNDYKKFQNQRGMILTRASGMAPHTTPISYSGETIVSWNTLKKIPRYTSNFSNLGVSWWSHDIGGFKDGTEDYELYIRYVQLGCFQPIFRFASASSKYYKREPWRWDIKTFGIVKDYCNLRARLIGYIYSEGYKYYKLAIPLIQPLYYMVPATYDDIDFKNEYFFGSELLVAPITKPKDEIMNRAIEQIYLPNGIWYDFKTGKKFIGDKRYVMFFNDEDYPVFAHSGSIIILDDLEENINTTNNPRSMEIHVFPGKDNIYNLYEDDGISSLYKDGYYIVTRFDYNYLANNYTLIIRPFEGKSAIIPEKRNYKVRFRNTKNANEVIVMQENTPVKFESYIEENDFVVEIKDVSTVKQLTINCKGRDIEIDATRIINEDIDAIISELPITTKLKDTVADIIFSNEDIADRRIAIKKLRRKGLNSLFIRAFLKLLDYTKDL